MMQLVAADALRSHHRVFTAAFKREIDLNLGRSPFSFIAAVLEPVFTIGIVCAWHYTVAFLPPYGTDVVLFYSTGMFALFTFVHLSLASRNSMAAFARNRRYPAEKALEGLLAAAALKIITYVMVGVCLFAAIYALRTPQAAPWNWSPILESMAALICMGLGVGLCSAVMQQYLSWWRFVWSIIARLQLLLSGVLMVPDHLPAYIRDSLAWNPLLHPIGLFRQGFYPQYPKFLYSEAYMWGWAFGSLVVGLVVMRLFRRKIG